MLVKAIAAVCIGLELWLVPAPYRAGSIVLTIAALSAFLAWAIVAPSAQFLVRSVCALPSGANRVAFTFDDGPDPVTTPKILALLAAHDAHATFFVVGERAEQYPELVARIVREGHAVGSHTFTHSHAFHFGSPAKQRADVQRGIDVVAKITGERPLLFRPPQGLRTPLLRDALASMKDLVCVTWTERGLDAMGRPARAIVHRLEHTVRPGAILTLHDGAGLGGTLDRAPTVEALGTLLDLAKARGLSCVSLAEAGT